MPRPQLILGGATLGSANFSTLDQLISLIAALHKHNITRIDTAALYPAANKGRSESILGEARQAGHLEGIHVDTKILTSGPDGSGTLTKAAITTSANASLARLSPETSNSSKGIIKTLYCHVFDPVTPLRETTSTIASLCQTKHPIEQIGVSNFSAPQIDAFISSCKETSCPNPVCFQGQYNALARNPEISPSRTPDIPSVLSTVRKHNMRFVAWSPLAGGFLTGKLTNGQQQGTRLGSDAGKFHRFMYDKPVMHDAVRMLEKVIAGHQTTGEVSGGLTALADASLRWLYWHSALREQDGIVLGVSSTEMLEANCDAISKGPLSDEVVRAFDSAWDMVKDDAPAF